MSLIDKEDEIKEKIVTHLKNVYDPEIPVNIYDLGLIYDIKLEERSNYLYCNILMTLTSPSCPVADFLIDQVRYVTLAVEEVDEAYVQLTFSPPWDKDKMSEHALEIMAAAGAVI